MRTLLIMFASTRPKYAGEGGGVNNGKILRTSFMDGPVVTTNYKTSKKSEVRNFVQSFLMDYCVNNQKMQRTQKCIMCITQEATPFSALRRKGWRYFWPQVLIFWQNNGKLIFVLYASPKINILDEWAELVSPLYPGRHIVIKGWEGGTGIFFWKRDLEINPKCPSSGPWPFGASVAARPIFMAVLAHNLAKYQYFSMKPS